MLDTNLPDLSLTELDELFDEYPEIKQQNSTISMVDPSISLSSLIRCTERLQDENQEKTTTVPLSVFIPSTATIVNSTITKQLPSPTNSSSKSTVVHSQSSSDDIESNNEQKVEEDEEEETAKDELASETPTNSVTTATTANPTSGQGGGEDEDDYIQCSLETVYTSTEMALSPPTRPSVALQTDHQHIIEQFRLLKEQILQSKQIQHESILNYHQTIMKVIESLQQANIEHEKQVEQLNSDLSNLNQDYETLKIQNDINEQTKQELTTKLTNLEKEFEEFRRQQDIETSQIVKALQSDFEFELEKVRSEHQETIGKLTNKQSSTATIDTQTDEKQVSDKQTSITGFSNRDQSTQTSTVQFTDQTIQTIQDTNDELIMRRSINQSQQVQFNLAIQRAVQNATSLQKKQILQLEQQLQDKRLKINKLKECVKNLQNFYTLSSTSPTPSESLPTINPSLLTASIDDEQENEQTTNRQSFIKRSEPISMPSTFVAQSILAAGNTTATTTLASSSSSSPKLYVYFFYSFFCFILVKLFSLVNKQDQLQLVIF